MTLEEILDLLTGMETEELVEFLGLTSYDIATRFLPEIIERREIVEADLENAIPVDSPLIFTDEFDDESQPI